MPRGGANLNTTPGNEKFHYNAPAKNYPTISELHHNW